VAEFLQQLVNGIAWGSIYALIALGYTMVYGVLRLINFAHGDVYMVGAYAGLFCAGWLRAGAEPTLGKALLVLAFAMAFCAAVGMLIERLAYRPVRRQPRLASLITAIGVSLFLENLGNVLLGARPRAFPEIIRNRQVEIAGVVLGSHQLLVLGVSVALMALLELVVHRTKIGKAMRAVSYSADAARLMGIPTDTVIAFTFAVGSALAAAAGVLVGLYLPRVDPLMGLVPGLKAFVAAVLGGIGSIPGAMVGGLVMGVAETMVVAYLSPTYRDAIAFAILILILLFRPSGLMGKHEVEKV
jgi:branched-chain amino acid transport system permease protein